MPGGVGGKAREGLPIPIPCNQLNSRRSPRAVPALVSRGFEEAVAISMSNPLRCVAIHVPSAAETILVRRQLQKPQFKKTFRNRSLAFAE